MKKRQLTKLEKENLGKFIKNALKFTAPALGVFFAQLATGVEWQAAGLVALLAFYGLAADYFKKFK